MTVKPFQMPSVSAIREATAEARMVISAGVAARAFAGANLSAARLGRAMGMLGSAMNKDREKQQPPAMAKSPPDDPPATTFERYLAEVDRAHPERPQYRSGPFRWWHPLPAVLMLGGAFTLAAWKVGQAWGAW